VNICSTASIAVTIANCSVPGCGVNVTTSSNNVKRCSV